MSEKRQLTEEEKGYVNTNIAYIADELEFEEAMAKEVAVLLEIAPVKFKKQVAELEKKLKAHQEVAESNTKALEILKDQLENGVEVKENSEKEVEDNE